MILYKLLNPLRSQPPTSVIKATSSDILSMQMVAAVTNLYAFKRMVPESYQSGFYESNGILCIQFQSTSCNNQIMLMPLHVNKRVLLMDFPQITGAIPSRILGLVHYEVCTTHATYSHLQLGCTNFNSYKRLVTN